MCGILGIVRKRTDPVLFENALNRLSHRGPDGSGIWHDTEAGVSFGHRRLSILDVSERGTQPMHRERYVIIFNGEIYNFLEIRTELRAKGLIFETDSDTEVILAAYLTWGKACLDRFNGMWALGIWDKEKRELFLARDRFGKKPLFYAWIGESLIFASEMKAITPFLSEVKPSHDFHWCRHNVFLYEATDKCLIQGIKRFPAGHYASIRPEDTALRLVKYWNTIDNLVEVSKRYEEQVEAFRELFIDACRLRMRADVPIGTALSGGLDSSAVVSTMAQIGRENPKNRVSDNWQHAFVATFRDSLLDERYYAQKVVRHLGIEATFIDIDAHNNIDKLDDYLYLFEELYLTTPIPMMETYRQFREQGIMVTLDGHGADELLSGYGYDLYEAFFDVGLNASEVQKIVDTKAALNPDTAHLNAPWWQEYAYYMARVGGINALHALNRVSVLKNRFRLPVARAQKLPQLDHFNSHLYNTFHETVMPTLLRNYDRYSMANGVEIRMPFLDHRLVSFLFSVPWSSKIRNGYTKSILRDAIGGFMPQEVSSRKSKIGFGTPLVDWMKTSWRTYLLEMIHSDGFNQSGFINPKLTRKLVSNVIHNANPSFAEGGYAWSELAPYLWEKSVLKKL